MVESDAAGSALASDNQDDDHNENNEMMDHNNEGEADQDIDQKEEAVNNNKFNIKNLNLKSNRIHEKKYTKEERVAIEESKSQDQQDKEAEENSEIN